MASDNGPPMVATDEMSHKKVNGLVDRDWQRNIPANEKPEQDQSKSGTYLYVLGNCMVKVVINLHLCFFSKPHYHV